MTQTRWTTEPWPWPEDTREDKAQRVAKSYRQLAFDHTQGRITDLAGELYRLDQQWLRRGAYWAIPSYDPYDADEWVNATDAAHYANVEPTTIRKWAERKNIRVDHDHDGTPLYNIGDLREFDARRKRARAERKSLRAL